MRRFIILLGMLLLVVGCKNKEEVIVLPEGVPNFVQVSDFEKIEWNNKAVEFGDRGIVGNENKSGVIGATMPSLSKQKWMWHLWGIEDSRDVKLTVVGYHRDSQSIHPILVDGWQTGLGGPVNGADAHTPSHVKIKQPGEWAILLYTDDKHFDTLIYNIKD